MGCGAGSKGCRTGPCCPASASGATLGGSGFAGLFPPPAPLPGAGTLRMQSDTAGVLSPSFLASSLTSQGLFGAHPASRGISPLSQPGRVLTSGSPPPAMPTLLFEPDDLRVGAEAVPGSAVVNGLEVGPDDVADGQRGDDALVCADCLHRVAPGGPRLQDVLLPGPSLPSKSRVSLGQVLRPPAGHPKARTSPTGRCLEGATHNPVWRRGAADEALDLPFLAVQGVLCLRAGDDGGPCKREERNAGFTHGQLAMQCAADSRRWQSCQRAPGTGKDSGAAPSPPVVRSGHGSWHRGGFALKHCCFFFFFPAKSPKSSRVSLSLLPHPWYWTRALSGNLLGKPGCLHQEPSKTPAHVVFPSCEFFKHS